MMRMVTRLAHSRAVVHPVDEKKRLAENSTSKADRKEWMLLPALARQNYDKMLAKQVDLTYWSDNCKWNKLELNSKRTDIAIITNIYTGIKNKF